MAYTLSQLLQDAYHNLGQTETFLATGGTTTTVVCTTLAETYQDDDLKEYTVFIARDAGGASAAPEGEYQRCSGYSESTTTITVDTAFTASPASGDTITIAGPMFPLRSMIELLRPALEKVGGIVLTYDTLSYSSGQSEYTLPVAQKRNVLRVQVQRNTGDSDDNDWIDIPRDRWEIVPSTAGSSATLIIKEEQNDGYTMRVWYETSHPAMYSYNSVLVETLYPTIAVDSLVAHACQWFNNKIGFSDDNWLQRENKAWRDLELSKAAHGIPKPKKKNKVLTISEDAWDSYPGDPDHEE